MELLLSLIPEDLKRQLLDGLVGFLAEQARQWVGEEVANRIRRLSSEVGFLKAFDQASKMAAERFVAEYTPVDEDLAAALAADPNFWKAPSVRKALMELVRRPGAWLPQEREQLAQRFADVLPQRVNRERVDRAVNFFLRCLAEELWTLPGAREVREIYSLQFQSITAEAVRAQEALVRQQLEALTTLSADLRAALGQLTEAMARQLLAAPAVPALPTRPRPYHNLPQPDYVRFVGREKELAWLRQRLSPRDRAWVLVITGIGGVGKSALALAIGHEYRRRYEELPPEERFEAIVWASAKERVLTLGGKKRAAPEVRIFRTLGDIYRAIAQTLDREDITRAPAEEQDGVVRNALTCQRTLLILDNMEEVTDEEVRAFLRDLPPPTKAIVTSREWIEVADVLQLMGMEREDAEALMTAEAEARGVTLDEAQREALYRRTAGLPLSIRLSVARLASGETFEQVQRWLGNAAGDLPQYCVGGQVELARQKDPNAWTLLLACSLFDRQAGASREALGAVADLSLADRDDGLTLLQRLNLLNRTAYDRFWMLPIVQEYARARLMEADFADDLTRRWLEWLLSFARTYGVDLDHRTENAPIVGTEYPNLREALRWCQQQERWETFLALAEGTWFYAYLAGLYEELEEILSQATEIARNVGDELREVRFERRWITLAWARGEYDKALLHVRRAEEILSRHPDWESELGHVWDDLADILWQKGQRSEAKDLARRTLELGMRLNDLHIMAVSAYRLSNFAAWEGESGEALLWLEKFLKWAQKMPWTRALAWYGYRRGDILIAQKKFAEAEPLLLEAMEKAASWGERRLVAFCKRGLALVYEGTGRLALARQTAEEARDLFDRLGLKIRERQEVEELLARLPQEANNGQA